MCRRSSQTNCEVVAAPVACDIGNHCFCEDFADSQSGAHCMRRPVADKSTTPNRRRCDGLDLVRNPWIPRPMGEMLYDLGLGVASQTAGARAASLVKYLFSQCGRGKTRHAKRCTLCWPPQRGGSKRRLLRESIFLGVRNHAKLGHRLQVVPRASSHTHKGLPAPPLQSKDTKNAVAAFARATLGPSPCPGLVGP